MPATTPIATATTQTGGRCGRPTASPPGRRSLGRYRQPATPHRYAPTASSRSSLGLPPSRRRVPPAPHRARPPPMAVPLPSA